MSIMDSRTRTLLTCNLFHLDPRIVNKRLALHGLLVEVSLFTTTSPLTLEEIQDAVDEIVQQRKFLQNEELIQALQDGIQKGAISNNEDRYELSLSARSIMDTTFKASIETRDNVCKGLVETIELEIGEPIDPAFAKDICDCVEKALTEKVYELSLQLARDKITMEEMLQHLDALEPLKDLESIFDKYVPPERILIRKQVGVGVVKYFQRMDSTLIDRLKLIHHTVLINQILNLDPDMVQIQKEWFSRRRLYLDTNVVISYVFEGQLLHTVVEEIIQATKNLDVQLFISPATVQELNSQILRAKQNHFKLERDPLIQKIAQNGDDAILATFIQLRKKQPSLDWDAFIAPFNELPETLIQYGILVEDECFSEAASYEKLPLIHKAISEAKPNWTKPNVITHDTLNCALIFNLRTAHLPDERGQVVWLLTIDHSLKRAQTDLFNSNNISSPYCMHIQEWGEIVLPAQNIMSFVFNDFIKYIAQSKLGALAEQQVVQLDFLETIRDSELDMDRLLSLHPDQVRSTLICLQSNREVRNLLRNVENTQDENQKKVYQEKLNNIVDQTINDTDPVNLLRTEFDQKMALFQKRVDERDQLLKMNQQQIEELSTRLAYAESSLFYRLIEWIKKLFKGSGTINLMLRI